MQHRRDGAERPRWDATHEVAVEGGRHPARRQRAGGDERGRRQHAPEQPAERPVQLAPQREAVRSVVTEELPDRFVSRNWTHGVTFC